MHEDGRRPEADVLQAADSLSFLETMVPLVLAWSERGYGANAAAKLRHSRDRIAPGLTVAPRRGARLVADALEQLGAAPARSAASSATGRRPPTPPRRPRSGCWQRPRSSARAACSGSPASASPGMPLFPGHPPFQVLSYRTPQGIRAAGDPPWGPVNDAGLGYMSEFVLGSQHTGAHIDAHAHMTLGPEDRWHGGRATTDLGDFGPLTGDATEIPPLWRRGVLYDVPGLRGSDALPAGEPVTADEVLAIEAPRASRPARATSRSSARATSAPGRTRSGSPATAAPARTSPRRGCSPERGVVAVGSDTETFEVQPAPDPGEPANPQPVHTLLLIEKGVYIMESLDLEALAAAQVREFLFVALPLAIRGATGSMLDPVAVV